MRHVQDREMTGPATRAHAIARAEAYVDDGRFEGDLARRVAIRTESQKFPDKGALVECYRYLETEMTPAFAAMGFQSRMYDNPFEGQTPQIGMHTSILGTSDTAG